MKDVQKSVRMTTEVFKIVDGQRGNGFNEKFENMVLDCFRRQDELRAEAQQIHAYIADLNDQRRRLQKKVRSMQDVDTRLKPLVDAVVALIEVK